MYMPGRCRTPARPSSLSIFEESYFSSRGSMPPGLLVGFGSFSSMDMRGLETGKKQSPQCRRTGGVHNSFSHLKAQSVGESAGRSTRCCVGAEETPISAPAYEPTSARKCHGTNVAGRNRTASADFWPVWNFHELNLARGEAKITTD